MPDGSFQGLRQPPSPPVRQKEGGFTLGAVLAIALHGAAVLPFLLMPAPPPAPSMVENVELSPVPDAAPPEAAQEESATEAVSAAPPDPAQVSETPPETTEPPPPDVQQTLAPPESVAPPRPPEPVQTATPDPAVTQQTEPVLAETPPPDPLPAETPDTAEAVQPPEETTTAALPPPPPSPPTPQPVRAVPPRPPRPAQAAPPRPVQAETPTAAAPAPPAPAVAASPPPPSYVGRLMAALERHKDYPSSARYRRAEGVVLLRFAMHRDGSVTTWRIERSSGHEDLDAAVAQMIRRASPLPAPPPELAGDPVEVVVPVRFTMR